MLYLAVEDVVRRVLLEFEVPHEGHPVRIVRDVGVGVIGHQEELRVLEGGGEEGEGDGRRS